jgi:hypothetical protein
VRIAWVVDSGKEYRAAVGVETKAAA